MTRQGVRSQMKAKAMRAGIHVGGCSFFSMPMSGGLRLDGSTVYIRKAVIQEMCLYSTNVDYKIQQACDSCNGKMREDQGRFACTVV